ncbi:MAG: transporter substrate-binding domain-containing protein [Sneathiella sp.]
MPKFSIRLFVLVWAAYFQAPFTFVQADQLPQKLVFSQISDSSLQKKASVVISAAYKNIGVEVQFMELPGRRALQFSNSGKTDGEVFRIERVGSKYTNLIKVPTSYMSFRGFAYSISGRKIDTWSAMEGSRVGIQRGLVWAEKGSKGMHVIRFDTNSGLLKKLLDGGIDMAVAGEFSFEKEIRKNDLGKRILKGKPLTDQKLFHYLNKKHKKLVPVLDAEILRMLSKGEVQRILKISTLD